MNEHREAIAEAIRSLNCLGMNDSEAEILAYLIGRDPCRSQKIEQDLSFSQPRVSRGLKTLREMDLVEKEETDWDQKGHPPILYSTQADWFPKLNEKIREHLMDVNHHSTVIFEESLEIQDDDDRPIGETHRFEAEDSNGDTGRSYDFEALTED